MKKVSIKKFLAAVSISIILLLLSPVIIILGTHKNIYKTAKEAPAAYTCLVLGARVYSSGKPSAILSDRLDTALKLYQRGKVKRFLLSGDHGQTTYDEVNGMRSYLMKKGIPSSDIFMDHAGFNTYSSMVRAKKVFLVDTMIVATQKYHLPRSIFLGNAVGIHTTGIISDRRKYPAIRRFRVREHCAQIKALFEALCRPKPKYLGEEIPITGDSKATHG